MIDLPRAQTTTLLKQSGVNLRKNKSQPTFLNAVLNVLQEALITFSEDYLKKRQETCLREFRLFGTIKLFIPIIYFQGFLELGKNILSSIVYSLHGDMLRHFLVAIL